MSDTHVEPLIYKSSEMVSGGQSASCIRCGLCLATCPVYRVTLKETDTPRGKIALLRAVNEGRLDPGQSFASRFYDCLLCGACANVCPSGVELEEILQAARDDLTNHKLQPEALARLGRVIWEHHNISGEDNAHRLIWTENMDAPPLGAEPKERADVA
jgi:Fe-S oxidoreductase